MLIFATTESFPKRYCIVPQWVWKTKGQSCTPLSILYKNWHSFWQFHPECPVIFFRLNLVFGSQITYEFLGEADHFSCFLSKCHYIEPICIFLTLIAKLLRLSKMNCYKKLCTQWKSSLWIFSFFLSCLEFHNLRCLPPDVWRGIHDLITGSSTFKKKKEKYAFLEWE